MLAPISRLDADRAHARGSHSPARRPGAARDSAVVLLHGLCSSKLEVRLFGRTLRQHGFDVVVPEIPGYTAGDAGSAAAAPDHRLWIDAVAAEVARLARSHARVNLCGVSLGATLALAVAARRTIPVASLSLISTTLFFDGWNVSPWRFLLPLAYYTPLGRLYAYRETPPYGVKNERVRAWIASQLDDGTLSSAGAATIPTPSLREAERLIRHVKRTLAGVSAPTIMFHARHDDVASLANQRYVSRRISSQVIHQVVMEDSYHMITLDNDRDAAASKTAQFFNTVQAGRSPHASAAAGISPEQEHPNP